MTQNFQLTSRAVAAITMVGALAFSSAQAADQTQPGAGNGAATQLARQSPLVQSAMKYLDDQAKRIHDQALRAATLDILRNPMSCAVHRRGLATPESQDAIIDTLLAQGLVSA